MKPVAKVVLAVAGTLFALHAPGYAQRLPDSYMEALRIAEAGVPTPAELADGNERTALKNASSQMGWLATVRAFTGDTEGAIAEVVFPRYVERDGRPEWLETLAGRTPRDIPPALLPTSGRRLIKAYRLSDGTDAVPTDNVMVEAGKPLPKLMLPKGDFRFAFED